MSRDIRSRFVRFLTLSCLVVSILALAIVVTPSVMAAPSDANSTTSSAVPLEPTEERVNPVTTIVDSTTFKVNPLEVPATAVDSATPTTPWPYIPIAAGAIICATVALAALALRRRGHRFSRLRLLSSLLLISLLTITISATPVYGQELTVSTWDLSGIGLYPIINRDLVDSAGNVWFGSGDKVGYLNPATNEIKTWMVPDVGNAITAVSVDGADRVWFLDSGLNRIGRLDPSTNFFTLWPIPTPSSGPMFISLDSAGNVYFSEIYANKIGRLNPTTNEITEWPIPTSDSRPFHTMLDSTGSVWFVENTGNKIAKLNPATNEVTEWPIPTPASGPCGLYVANGQVYFAEWSSRKIGRLNLSTNEITEWSVTEVTGGFNIFGLFVDSKANAWTVAVGNQFIWGRGVLCRIGSDNILTYWIFPARWARYYEFAVDTKVNLGDIYVVTDPSGILRFHSAAA